MVNQQVMIIIHSFIHFTQLFSTECLSSNGITVENSTSTQSCRICQTSGNSEPEVGELLASPCDCRGSLGFVHKQCMEKWLRVRNRDTCELCHFKFVTKRRFKPPHEVSGGPASTPAEKYHVILTSSGYVMLLSNILDENRGLRPPFWSNKLLPTQTRSISFPVSIIRVWQESWLNSFDGQISPAPPLPQQTVKRCNKLTAELEAKTCNVCMARAGKVSHRKPSLLINHKTI